MISVQKQRDILIVTTPADLIDADWRTLQSTVLTRTRAERIRAVVLDVTATTTMDSYATRLLSGVGKALKLLGAEAIVVGIQPDVAFAMAQLGLRLETPVALDLDEGLQLAANLRG